MSDSAYVWVVNVDHASNDVRLARHKLVKKTAKQWVVNAGPATNYGTNIHIDDQTVRVFESEMLAREYAAQTLRRLALMSVEITRRLRIKAEGIQAGKSNEEIDDEIHKGQQVVSYGVAGDDSIAQESSKE